MVLKKQLNGIMQTKLKHNLYWLILKVSRNNFVTRGMIDISAFLFYKIFRSNKSFTFNKKKYKYFYHLYNRTVASERVVEIPIAKRILDKYRDKDILEVGSVMNHYFSTKHTVLDKHEKGKRVVNKDVINFNLKKKFDLILSVSTMEHVGYSKRYWEPTKPKKFSLGIRNLKKHLKKGGLMVVTFPLYYNKYISDLIIKKKDPFQKIYFLKRVSHLNEWKQVSFKEAIKGNSYEGHFANANILCVCEYKKK